MMKQIKDFVTKQAITAMPQVLFKGRVIVVSSVSDANKAVDYLNGQQRVGVDTETRPSFRPGLRHKVALLQLSTEDVCFLFRLNKIGIPDKLADFLQNGVLKIGLSLKDDFIMLTRRKKMNPTKGEWVELQLYVQRFGIKDLSLQKIYANLFGQRIAKSQQLTNWEADTLSKNQALYAATDAWACLRIYEELQKLDQTNGYRLMVTKTKDSVP